jgi:hypothetical protein
LMPLLEVLATAACCCSCCSTPASCCRLTTLMYEPERGSQDRVRWQRANET